MNSECMKVLALGIFGAKAAKLTANQAAWHRLFMELKHDGLEPAILGQLRFRTASGGRAFSDDIEQLLFVITRAEGSVRENPVLQVIELKDGARQQFRSRYADVAKAHDATVSRIASAIDEQLALK